MLEILITLKTKACFPIIPVVLPRVLPYSILMFYENTICLFKFIYYIELIKKYTAVLRH